MTTRARAFYLLKKSDKSNFIRLFKSDFIGLFKIRSTALARNHNDGLVSLPNPLALREAENLSSGGLAQQLPTLVETEATTGTHPLTSPSAPSSDVVLTAPQVTIVISLINNEG